MAWGTAPGQAVKDDWYDRSKTKVGGARSHSPIYELMKYFLYHPRKRFGVKIHDEEKGALAASFKRLRQSYTDDSIRRAVDRFYMTRTSVNHPHPGWAFCNKEFQDKLFMGATLAVEEQDEVLDFLARGFVRGDADLPWTEEHDADLRLMFIINKDMNTLVRSYPEVVAEILSGWGPTPDGERLLKEALHQAQHLHGAQDKPSSALKEMSGKFTLPKDFVKTNRPRRAKDTITEAVRSARGR